MEVKILCKLIVFMLATGLTISLEELKCTHHVKRNKICNIVCMAIRMGNSGHCDKHGDCRCTHLSIADALNVKPWRAWKLRQCFSDSGADEKCNKACSKYKSANFGYCENGLCYCDKIENIRKRSYS